MGQDRYRDQIKFTPGMMVYDRFGKKRTVLNKHPQAKQVDEVTVSGASANSTYTIAIDDVDITYTTGGSPGQDDLGQGLTDAINNENLVSGTVTASYDSGSNIITITADLEGIGFSYAEVADPSGDLSQNRVTQNATANPIPWGRAVEDHGTLGEKLGRLADASNFTSRDIQVTLDGYSAGTYTLALEVAGDTVYASDTGAGDVDTTLQNLRDDINNNSDLLSASVDTNPTPSELHIQPETAGFADFDIKSADPADSQEFTITTDAEGGDFAASMAGVATAGGQLLYESDVDVGRYQPNEEVDIVEDGAWVAVEVEEEPSLGDPVYVRLSANGNLDKLGAFRASWDSGCIPLPDAKWVDKRGSNTAAIEVP